MSPVTIAIAGLVAFLVLAPTRRLQRSGWTREALTTYFAAVWLLGMAVAVLPVPARFLVPILLIAYLAPFTSIRAGLGRLFGRPVPRPPVQPERPPVKNVTPPEDRDR